MIVKRCFKCLEVKALDEFYRHPETKDGTLNKCKDCARQDVIENRQKRADYYREFDRKRAMLPHRVEARNAYKQTPNGKRRIREASERWKSNNPEKRRAQVLVKRLVKRGAIERKPCEVCRSLVNIHAHHDDYSKPLDVRWLCGSCHSKWHRTQERSIGVS